MTQPVSVHLRERPLRICLLSYRSHPHCGGQGVYVKHLGRGLSDLGHRVTVLEWRLEPEASYRVQLRLLHRGQVLNENSYEDPFRALPRPQGYPWRFDRKLGMRCYGGRHARSSLKVFNTWYGRLAAWILPVYEWAEEMLDQKPSPKVNAWLKRLFG